MVKVSVMGLLDVREGGAETETRGLCSQGWTGCPVGRFGQLPGAWRSGVTVLFAPFWERG